MDQLHKQILRKNRTVLIDNIAKPDDVSDLLYERQVFTESMRQDVEAKNTSIEKTRHILDLIPRRGPRAFDALVAVLRDTGNDAASAILQGGQTGSQSTGAGQEGVVGYAVPTRSSELPKEWPSEQAMTEEIKVRTSPLDSDLVRYKWLSEDVYSMIKRIRGRCVIISNKIFRGPLQPDEEGKMRCMLSDRHGTEQDETALKLLFTQLQFSVVTHKDKEAKEMLDIFEAEARHQSHSEAECFVCVICSHGTREGIYGVDGGVIRLDQVTSYFDGDNCVALRRKPKLFFIQACQGETSDVGTNADLVDGGPDLSELVQKMTLENRTDAEKEQAEVVPQARNVPAKTDMLVASATHPGYVSLRNIRYGSWFIQAVIYVFQRFAAEKHILDLLTLVNKLVAKGRTPTTGSGEAQHGQIMQAAVFHSSLIQDFYFFPGIVENT